MTEKRFWLSPIVYDGEQRFVRDKNLIGEKSMSNNEVVDLLNSLTDENKQLKRVIAENEKLIQSTYDELTKLRCIKKNLGRIKAQWDWIMEAIQYD